MDSAIAKHLKTGSTTVCRAWLVQRADGLKIGFTDHDCDIKFDGVNYSARTGLTAQNIEKTLGMAVDNTEVIGALSDASLSENDIMAGRYDGAEVTEYLINWENLDERSVLFKGTFGDITRSEGAFRVELRGLSMALNLQSGRVYHPECSAALGDSHCKIDLSDKNYRTVVKLEKLEENHSLYFFDVAELEEGWFRNGTVIIKNGVGYGQVRRIRSDIKIKDRRKVDLWQPFGLSPENGDELELIVGCDKRASVCQKKFANFLNFRGFPHIPGEDWLRAGPNSAGRR